MMRGTGVLFALALLVPAAQGQAQSAVVTGVRVEPHTDRTELVIEIDGAVSRWADFALSGPARIVVDIPGARNQIPANRYASIGRGGVRAVRASQFSADTVRVVIDLISAAPYEVSTHTEGLQVRIDVPNEPAASESTEPLRPAQTVTRPGAVVQEQPRITVTFQEADIRDVLATFAEFTGRSIVPGSGVSGSVTASIRNQPWDVALQTILSAYGLAAQEMPSGIIQVDALDVLLSRQSQDPLITRTFRINYVPVAELRTTIEPLMSPDRGRISVNASTNTLVLTDTRAVVEDVAQMLNQLDIRTPQVSIEAKIIFVNRSEVEDLGVSYNLTDSNAPELVSEQDVVQLGGSAIAALGNATARVQDPSLQTIVAMVLGRFTLVTFVEALQSASLTEIQAAPLIRTLDNQPAEIWVGEETPIRVIDAASAGGAGGGGAPRATAQLVETGIRLQVTPHITADRRILMQIQAENSSAVPASGDIGVQFQRQRATNRVMVRDGETIVIAGLTVTQVLNTRTGIPFLMDLPGLGWLFRRNFAEEQQRDLLIMVTPRIIQDTI